MELNSSPPEYKPDLVTDFQQIENEKERELGAWVGGVEGLNKREKKKEKALGTGTAVVTAGGGSLCGEVEEGRGGEMAMEGGLTLVGDHTVQCR